MLNIDNEFETMIFKKNDRCPMHNCKGRMKKKTEPKDVAGGDARGFYLECNKCGWEDRICQEVIICVRCKKPIPDKDIPKDAKSKIAIQYFYHFTCTKENN